MERQKTQLITELMSVNTEKSEPFKNRDLFFLLFTALKCVPFGESRSAKGYFLPFFPFLLFSSCLNSEPRRKSVTFQSASILSFHVRSVPLPSPLPALLTRLPLAHSVPLSLQSMTEEEVIYINMCSTQLFQK